MDKSILALSIIRMRIINNPRDVKLVLARMITGLYHDPQKCGKEEEFYAEAFGRKGIPEQVDELVIRRKITGTVQIANNENIESAEHELLIIQDLITPLVTQGVIKSGNEFRRMCAQGGIHLNGVKVSELSQSCKEGDVIKIGKKQFLRIIIK
jgi:tyrosyl-tRNA synthetase